VHSHLEDGQCEGKALPFLWNSGAYFDEGCLKYGKLHLFAHFERKGSGSSALQTPATSTAPSFSGSHTKALSRTPLLPSPTAVPDVAGLPLSAHQGPARRTGLSVSIPQRQKSANVHDLLESDSDVSGETHYLLSPSDPGGRSDAEGGAQAVEPLPMMLQLLNTHWISNDSWSLTHPKENTVTKAIGTRSPKSTRPKSYTPN